MLNLTININDHTGMVEQFWILKFYLSMQPVTSDFS